MWVYLINIILAGAITKILHEESGFFQKSGLLSLALFVVSFILLCVIAGIFRKKYITQIYLSSGLFLFFLKELVVANLKVSYEVLSPGSNLHPAVITVPLDLSTDLEIMLLANMITLTPGTLSLDVSEDKKKLYVHTLYSEESREVFRKNIKQGFEKKILAISQL